MLHRLRLRPLQLLVAALAALLAVTALQPLAQSASARPAALKKVTVTFKASPSSVNAGSKTNLSGTVKPFHKGSTVALQKLVGPKWVTFTSTKVDAKGKFTAKVTVKTSSIFRAVALKSGSNASAASLSTSVITNPVIATTSLAKGFVGGSYKQTLTAGGGTVGTWSASPLPHGLTLKSSTGVISGTPTTAGTVQVKIGFTQAVTKQKAPSKTLALQVVAPVKPVITTASLPNGLIGGAYSQTLTATASGSPATGTWTASPLPAGLSLNASTGKISGTPTTAGTTQVSIGFTQAGNPMHADAVVRSLQVTAPVPPTITTSSLPDGVVGAPYSTTLAAGNGGNPVSGTWTAAPLPAGLTLNASTGTISGTPSAAATTAVTVGFTQTGNPSTATPVQLNLTVKTPKPAILTTSLPDAKIGSAYSATLHVSGNVAGTWGVTGLNGTGLSLNPSTGVISGTALALLPTTANLTVSFTETSTGTAADPVQLTIRIANSNPNHAIVGAGGQYSCRVDVDQALWCWGYDDSGEIGDGGTLAPDPPGILKPKQVGTATDWSGLTTGASSLLTERHACAIRGTTGYCWGSDKTGELGSSSATGSATSPVVISGGLAWSQLSAGWTSTCGVTTNGALYCWGGNTFGQLGNPGGNQETPVRVGLQNDWVQTAVGYNHACATKADHSLWCWGYNIRGQLGNGGTDSTNTPVQVDGGNVWSSVTVASGYTCAIRTTGTLWCWGPSANGELGNGVTLNDTSTDVLSPLQIGSASNWTGVSGDDGTTCAVNADGEIWCWGKNGSGQVGDNSLTTRSVPTRVGTATDWESVSVGDSHTCATKTSGAVWCWGNNSKGELGINAGAGATPFSKVPVAVVG